MTIFVKPDLTRQWALGALPANIVDPDTTTPGKYNTGWAAEIPPFEHFNFLQNQFSGGLAYLNQQGIASWDILSQYPVGGVVKGSDGQWYRAKVEQTGNDPVGDSTNWTPFLGINDQSTTKQISVSDTSVVLEKGLQIKTGILQLFEGDSFPVNIGTNPVPSEMADNISFHTANQSLYHDMMVNGDAVDSGEPSAYGWFLGAADGGNVQTDGMRMVLRYRNFTSATWNYGIHFYQDDMVIPGDLSVGTISSRIVQNFTTTGIASILSTNTSASPFGITFNWTVGSPDNNSNYFFNGFDASTQRIVIWSDGDLANHDGVYGTISARKLKTDFAPVRSYKADFADLKIQKYRMKSDIEQYGPDCDMRIGLIAEEVEDIFPMCVVETPDEKSHLVSEEVPAILDKDGKELKAKKEAVYEMRPVLDKDGVQTTTKFVKSSIIEGPIMASVVQELIKDNVSLTKSLAVLKASLTKQKKEYDSISSSQELRLKALEMLLDV